MAQAHVQPESFYASPQDAMNEPEDEPGREQMLAEVSCDHYET